MILSNLISIELMPTVSVANLDDRVWVCLRASDGNHCHQFRCYLETLLGQVRMRAVLANDFPVQFGANDSFSSPTSRSWNSGDDADSAWDEFAVAV